MKISVANNSISKVEDIYNEHRSSYLTKLKAVITMIAIPILLSTVGLLPSIIWKVTICVTVIRSPLNIFIAKILENFKPLERDPKKTDQFITAIIKKGPISVCLLGPVIEEIFFRGVLQGGLTLALRQILPVAAIAIGGTSILISSALAMVVASSVFGYAHAHQSPIQAIIAGFGSLMIEAPLFHFYGLHMACLAHIVNNTVVLLLMTACMELKRMELKRAEPILFT